MLTRIARSLGLQAALLLGLAAPVAAADATGAARQDEWQAAYAETRRLVEELRAEVDAMKRLRAAQAELMAWNRERAQLGLPAITLRPELCLEEENARWCRLFPATFGVGGEER